MVLKLAIEKGSGAILDALLASRWSARDDGWWCVPAGEDVSEWRLLEGTSRTKLDALFCEKMNAGETFGIRLWWEGNDVGGELLVSPSGELVFSPTMDRVTLDSRMTDVSWYLSRLLPLFTRPGDVQLDSWSWSETA
ncbi:hypothetical protein [Sorangium sp. So ce887]|uniref:hypothetical protein n=1 Tax=Sorangium sp. So ce887 TaxID=3133324 RepID=UPI003F5FA503